MSRFYLSLAGAIFAGALFWIIWAHADTITTGQLCGLLFFACGGLVPAVDQALHFRDKAEA